MQEQLYEIQQLLSTVSPQRIAHHTRDLHFVWDNLDNLKPGQAAVLLKRLRRASRKTDQDFEDEAEASLTIQAMRASLATFMWKLRNPNAGQED